MHSSDIAPLITSISSLLSAIAWPIVVVIIVSSIYSNSDFLTKKVNDFMSGKESAKIIIGPSGITGELVAAKATKAVVESIEKSQNTALDRVEIQKVSESAQAVLKAADRFQAPDQSKFRILWVDDHPENNIRLQYAFQILGISVINIDTNSSIDEAFYVSSGYNVVITDMHRDGISGKTEEDPAGGLETIRIIRDNYPGIPVIIFAGYYAKKHSSDELQSPVIKITNSPKVVFSTVADLAKISDRELKTV